MAFILGDQRDANPAEAFRHYRQYLESERDRFPPSAFALATSEWYFNFKDHRCPHDAWLQHLVTREIGRGERHEQRTTASSLQLLGAYHDLVLTFSYQGLHRYVLEGHDVRLGHGDWRYDEFRVNEAGRLVHEIEWWGSAPMAHWLIEADDVTLEWSLRTPDRG
jgi:hypothetical protein